MPSALTTLLLLPAVCSVLVPLACLLWCRGLVPILATTFVVAACVVLT
ncbi:hypothetical protein [uncultured Variovorax sp.]|nr:hypothetical protein [uncultured Variovorax sp.]